MLTILTALWLCLPMAPFNPIEEDTLAAMSLHVTAGISTPSQVAAASPEITAKYELLAVHPLVLRAAVDYQYGATKSAHYPAGKLHQATLSLCAVYYRGTDKFTGYLGAGPVYRIGRLNLSSSARDSLLLNENVFDVDLRNHFGFRIVLGLRYMKAFSLEIAATEIRTDLVYREKIGPASYATTPHEARLSSIRISLGYVWTIRDIW